MNVSMKKLAVALAVASTLTVSTVANANTVITFDDLSGNGQIANGYAGLDWSNFYVLNGSTISGSGYSTGVVSAPNVAYNAWDYPASFSSGTAFNLVSMDVTKAWYAGVTHFDGYVGNTLAYSKDVSSTTAGPTLAAFNWTGLNKVTMSDGNGTYHSVIDNVTVAAVPEPETYGMMLAGLGLMGFMVRRKKSA